MKTLLQIAILIGLSSCGHSYNDGQKLQDLFKKREANKSDTLRVSHTTCFNCESLTIDSGNATIPEDLVQRIGYSTIDKIKLCGNFPIDIIDMRNGNFKLGDKYKIIGKVITVDTTGEYRGLPLFYVTTWEKISSNNKPTDRNE